MAEIALLDRGSINFVINQHRNGGGVTLKGRDTVPAMGRGRLETEHIIVGGGQSSFSEYGCPSSLMSVRTTRRWRALK
jgi:hypothetical protein